MTDTQSKAPVDDRIAEIRERADLESRPGRLPRSSIADLREDRAYLLTELTASQSRERALTEERDDALREADDQRCRANAMDRRVDALTSENKALKEALEFALPLVEKWCHTQGNTTALRRMYLGPIEAALALNSTEKSG